MSSNPIENQDNIILDGEAGMEEELEAQPLDKIQIIAGGNDLTATTFQLKDEDHTVGNSLRWTVAKDPQVEYVGYSIPHPSEPLLNFRIQTMPGKTTVQALDDGLDNLIALSQHIAEAFQVEFNKGKFEVLRDDRELVIERVSKMMSQLQK